MEFKERLLIAVQEQASNIVKFKYLNGNVIYDNDFIHNIWCHMHEISNDNELAYLNNKLSLLRAEIDLYLLEVLPVLQNSYSQQPADSITLDSITTTFIAIEREREAVFMPTLHTLIYTCLGIIL